MVRMAKAIDIRKMLLKIGFEEVAGSVRHLKYRFIHDDGAWMTYVSLSKGRKEVTAKTLNWIRRQTKLDNRNFEMALACPLKEKDYRAFIEAKLQARSL